MQHFLEHWLVLTLAISLFLSEKKKTNLFSLFFILLYVLICAICAINWITICYIWIWNLKHSTSNMHSWNWIWLLVMHILCLHEFILSSFVSNINQNISENTKSETFTKKANININYINITITARLHVEKKLQAVTT